MGVIAGISREPHNYYEIFKAMTRPRGQRGVYQGVSMYLMTPPTRPVYSSLYSCSKPPYPMEWKSEEQKREVENKIENGLYASKGWNWIEGDPEWSAYWDSGREWWGCHCVTHYMKDDRLLVLSAAAPTD
eukprot:Phypoly_transcript_18047.p1 GENE.Phypoly_transcript_18047~~Phypoly_transcript_18047.p1  ORF type:complete len:130 (+),score=14.13 Phypoly_transcript_18047:379-768(+)